MSTDAANLDARHPDKLTLRLDPATLARLDEAAKERGLSRATLVRDILLRAVDPEQKCLIVGGDGAQDTALEGSSGQATPCAASLRAQLAVLEQRLLGETQVAIFHAVQAHRHAIVLLQRLLEAQGVDADNVNALLDQTAGEAEAIYRSEISAAVANDSVDAPSVTH